MVSESGRPQGAEAAAQQARPGLPVLLVAGFSQAARHRAIQEWLRSQPSPPTVGQALPGAGPRMAWLDHQDRAATLAAPAPTQSFQACVCCSGSLVFATHLTRLLRQPGWQALLISLGAQAQPARMVQLLTQAPWSQHLGPVRLVSIVDELTRQVAADPAHALHEAARQQLDASDRLIGTGHPLPPDLLPQAS